MMVRVGGGWDTLEHFLSRHEPCQVRLVTPGRGRRPRALAISQSASLSPAGSLPSLGRAPSAAGTASPSAAGEDSPPARTISPVDSKASSVSGKASPVRGDGKTSRAGSGESSPRTSTPKPVKNRSGLTLPLRSESADPSRKSSPAPRTRKQSAPSFSTPSTPTAPGRSVRTPPVEYRKSLTSAALVSTAKKSRSMSLANQNDAKFCGTDRLNATKGRSVSAATTPTSPAPRKTRSQSLATTPVAEPKKPAISNGYAKKTRSMSLVAPAGAGRSSVSSSGALTQAAIEESIRRSLAASIADEHDTSKKPFLHIKAKYRSPPPREVPPR